MPAKNSLPRSKSLKSKPVIDGLLESGEKLSGDSFLTFFSFSTEFKTAILVGRKFGTAVERNRIKRRFKEAIRVNLEKLVKPVHIVFLPHKEIETVSVEKLDAEISRLFDRINAKA